MKTWIGSTPERCDICKNLLGDNFLDGKTIYGPWAIMCNICSETYSVGIGLGKGQVYQKETINGKTVNVKIAG